MARISHFECGRCGVQVAASAYEQNLRLERGSAACPQCASALLVRYDLSPAVARPSSAPAMSATIWRYAAVLPELVPLTLGEGFTPLLPSRNNPRLLIKNEGLNPTGTAEARGMCMVVAMAVRYGLHKLALASTGDSACALAAYAAAAGLDSFLFLPRDVSRTIIRECQTYGARVSVVDGSITDCARVLAERQHEEGFYDISRFSFPFQVEGNKTIGYEIAEQMGWALPDAILYPTDNGLGLLALWKAMAEMQQLGWLPSEAVIPKLIAVQSAGYTTIVKAWDDGTDECRESPGLQTPAAGLRVHDLALQVLKASGGMAVAVTDHGILDVLQDWARREGILTSPKGASTLVAYRRLLASGFLNPEQKVVLVVSGSGLNDAGGQSLAKPKPRALGGIIQPY